MSKSAYEAVALETNENNDEPNQTIANEHEIEDLQTNPAETDSSKDNSKTVDDILTEDAKGYGNYQWILFTITGLAWSFHCQDVFAAQYLIASFGSDWQLSKLEKSFIGVCTFTGWAMGAYLWGFLSDKYGRRRLLLICAGVVVALCATTGFAPNYGTLLLIRFCTGMFTGGINLLSFAIFSEFVDPKNRGWSMILWHIFLSFGEVELACWGFISFQPGSSPMLLMLMVAIYGIGVFVLLMFLLPESARYLIVSGQTEKASEVLQNLIRWNTKTTPSDKLLNLKQTIAVSRGSLREILRSELKSTVLSMWLIWFSAALAFFGSSLNFGHVGDINLALLYLGLAQIPAILIALVLVHFVGRKKTALLGFLGSALCFGVMMAFPDNQTARMLLNLGASNSSSVTFNALYLWTAEIFPTSVRSVANGSCQAWSRLGAALAPFCLEYLAAESDIAVHILFVAFCGIAFLLGTRLSETGHQPLKETLGGKSSNI